MNIYDLTLYVNQDVDDTFDVEDIVRWFNKGISQYNLLSPITTYPLGELNDNGDDWDGTGKYPSHSTTDYPLDDTFMLGVILPFISASVRGQESSLGEKQMFLNEFMMNARLFKNASNVPYEYLKIKTSPDLEKYQIGENVYVSDMSFAPFKNDWTTRTTKLPEFTQNSPITTTTPTTNDPITIITGIPFANQIPRFITDAPIVGVTTGIPGQTYYSFAQGSGFYYRADSITGIFVGYFNNGSYIDSYPASFVTNQLYYDSRTQRFYRWDNISGTEGRFSEVF